MKYLLEPYSFLSNSAKQNNKVVIELKMCIEWQVQAVMRLDNAKNRHYTEIT